MKEHYNTMLGAWFFAFVSIASGFVTTQRFRNPRNSGTMKSMSSSQNDKTAHVYENVVLELQYRGMQSTDQLPQKLQNDDILSKVVSLVKKNLYIYVVHNAASSTASSNSNGRSDMCEYISSLYSRVWDEMLQKNTLSLNCVIVGDVPGGDLVPRSNLLIRPSINAVFTFETLDSTACTAAKTSRLQAGLPEVEILNTDQFTSAAATAAISSSLVEAPIYYFDDCAGEIPVYHKVALGGTFDQLHNGHRKLLTLAAVCCTNELVVGITGDIMLQKKKNAEQIASYEVRKQGVNHFLLAVKPHLTLDLCELSDPFGPTITDPLIEALVVSSETIPGAYKINTLRVEKGYHPLVILVSRRSDAATLSSTFLRTKTF